MSDSATELGCLFMVATPIGNTEDFSPRGRRILASCDLVLAEDTRRSLSLCREIGIRVKAIESFHDHNEQEKEAQILNLLQQGKQVALISDAGTPLIADPGFRLVKRARELGIPVSPIPGPSAPVTALSAAGIPPLPYTFLAFLPRDDAGKRKLFSSFATVPTTLIFFERKDRLKESLRLAREILGPRQGAVCRELTKKHEEFILFRLEDETVFQEELLGELTVLIGPPEGRIRSSQEEARAVLAEEIQKGGKPKEIAKRAQERLEAWSAKELYGLLQ